MTGGTARRRRAERRGRMAETAAAMLLRLKGYGIVARRVRTPKGELDIVARRSDTIVFVEVKRRASHDLAIEAVTPRQTRRIIEAARAFLPSLAGAEKLTCRFDIILVSPYLKMKHVENAFDESR